MSTAERTVRIVVAMMVLMIALVLIMQTRLLYVFPQPDGARWWGDETGQMVELKAELTDGYAHIPTALGSSLAVTNGLVRGNSWMAVTIYGLPALVFSGTANIVSIGRTITLVLSLVLLFALWRVLSLLSVPPLYRLLAILVLISTRSFFYASHAARLDIAAGLVVLVYVGYLSRKFSRLAAGSWQPGTKWWFGYGATTMAAATLSIHLLTLLGLLSLFILWRFRAHRNWKHLASAIGGVTLVVLLLLLTYTLAGAPFTMFGYTARPNQFQSVVNMLPIQRLFSRSVQFANITERARGMSEEAPAVLLLLLTAILVYLINRKRIAALDRGHRFFLEATGVIALAWLFFQSPALYYYLHVLPLFIAASMLVIASRVQTMGLVIGIASILLCITAVRDSLSASILASSISSNNRSAVAAAVDIMKRASPARPIVLAQNPAIAQLLFSPEITLMTAHIVSFPVNNTPLALTLHELHAEYILLYASAYGGIYSEDYAMLRPLSDSVGRLVYTKAGVLSDVGRDYFHPDTTHQDTLLLYKLN